MLNDPDEAFFNFKKAKLLWKGLSEADTRSKIIDEIFKGCLGWSESDIVREESIDGGFVDYIFSVEGGYCVDSGGETRYGISKKAYPLENIKDMIPERAGEIYRADFWDRAKCPKFPAPIALAHFDAAVNHGIRQASIFLQRSINQNLINGTIGVDGMIGAETISAVMALEKCGKLQELVDAYLKQRVDFYTELATAAKYKPYLKGWLNRLDRLKIAIKNIPEG